MRLRVAMLLLQEPLHPIRDQRVMREAETLLAAGHEVTVFCWDRDGAYATEELSGGVRVVRHGPVVGNSPLGFLRRIRAFREVARRVTASVGRYRPDILHAHDLHALPVGCSLARQLRVPLVYDSHEHWPALELSHGRLRSWFADVYERRLARRADAVVTIGARVAERFRPLVGRVLVLYNSPRLSAFPAPRRTVGGTPELPGEGFQAVIMGKVLEIRGADVAMEAMREAGPAGVTLVFLGGTAAQVAEHRSVAVRLGVERFCRFDPAVPLAEVPAALSRYDAALIPHRRTPLYEIALGNRAFEYLAAGLPIVATDLAEVRETLGPTGAVILVAPDDSGALARGLLELKSAPERGRRMGEAARSAFERRFAWDLQEARLVSLYEELTRGRPAAPGGGG